MKRHEISEKQWNRIKSQFPPERKLQGGRPGKSNREMLNKGYDSDKFVRWVEKQGGIVVVPSRVNAKHPRHTDWYTYKERHLVENLFPKFKAHRPFATRYEKRACLFFAVTLLAAILVWIA